MPLKRLDHIAFRVVDINPVVTFYTSHLGFRVVQEMKMDFGGSKAYSKVLNLPGIPYYIFVDQGLDEENIITRWVKKHGSRLHHMAYLVDDIDVEAKKLRKSGLTFTTDRIVDSGGGLKQLFTKPHPVTGVITEIIERYRDNIFFVQENVIQLIRSTEGL